jgi:tetratricopeptide (TPR) repeat protein
MKNYQYLLITLSIVLLNVGFNIALQEIRISDVNSTLTGVNSDEDPHESLTILGRFQIVRNRFQSRGRTQEDYQLEARMQLLANYKEQIANLQLPEVEDWYLMPVRMVVNTVRLAIGKSILTEPSPRDQAVLEELEKAYILERARRYESANEIYRSVLLKPIPDTWRISVLLHKGYCSAMSHNFDEARQDLNTLLRDYPDSSAAGVARRLVQYIDEFETSWLLVMEQTGDLLEKGKNLFYVLDYGRAQTTLEEFLYKNPRDPRIAEALYFLGRSKEEQGSVLAAIVDYRGTISLDAQGPWGEAAWIRLYLLGEFYLQDQSLALESREQLEERGKERIFEKLAPMVELVKAREIAPVVLENRRLINSEAGRQPNSGLSIVEQGRDNQSELIDPSSLRIQDTGELAPRIVMNSEGQTTATNTGPDSSRGSEETALTNTDSQLNAQTTQPDNTIAEGNQQNNSTPTNPGIDESGENLALVNNNSENKNTDSTTPADPPSETDPPNLQDPGREESEGVPQGWSSSPKPIIGDRGFRPLPTLPSFPSPFEEDTAKSIDELRQLAAANWWPGSEDFQRIREIEEELLRDDLPPGVRAELEEILTILNNRIEEKRSMEATIANLKSQALAYEEAYQAFLASKPDYATPRTVSFVLGGTFLAGTGTSFALSQSFGAELASTLQISTSIMAGISLISGGVFWLLDADEGLDKPKLDEVLAELQLVEGEYQSRRRETQSVQ